MINRINDKILLFWVTFCISSSALANNPDPDQGGQPEPFTAINNNATIDNVAENSKNFLGNMFEFFVNLGLVAGVIVGFAGLLKAYKISNGTDQGSYIMPVMMMLIGGALTSVWFVLFAFSNTVETLAG